MVNNPRFVEAIQAKIGTAVDTEDMEKQIAVLQGRLKQAFVGQQSAFPYLLYQLLFRFSPELLLQIVDC